MLTNNISTLIGKNRLTIAEVSRIAKLKYNTVYDLYYDKTTAIKFDTIDKLCFALNCTPNDLFTYIED